MADETMHPGLDDPMVQSELKEASTEVSEKINGIFEEASREIPNLKTETDKIYLKSTSGLLRLMKFEDAIYIAGASNDYTTQLAGQLAKLIKERLGLEAKVF